MSDRHQSSSGALTIYRCPKCERVFDHHPMDHVALTGFCAGDVAEVRVFAEDDVRPLWEAASEVYEDSGAWKELRRPLRDFPAPDDWKEQD